MKRVVPFLLVGAVCYCAGYASSARGIVSAQAGGGRGQAAAPEPKAPQMVDGKAVVYTKEQLERMFPSADKAGNLPPLTASTHLGWDPFYRFTEMRRVYYDPARKDANTGEMINYPGAEMHENKTQIYIVWKGTATMALGGTPERERPGPYVDGQHGGANKLVGAELVKVKPGDVIIIPPKTWHHALVDPGQTFTYHMCHVETPRLIP